jgi:hypothetical protein
MAHQVWYHGTRAENVAGIRRNGLRPPAHVAPAHWYMLTTSREQAAVYAGPQGVVLEFHVPVDAAHYRKPGGVLWPRTAHTAYGFDADAVGIKGVIPAAYLVAEHPAD